MPEILMFFASIYSQLSEHLIIVKQGFTIQCRSGSDLKVVNMLGSENNHDQATPGQARLFIRST